MQWDYVYPASCVRVQKTAVLSDVNEVSLSSVLVFEKLTVVLNAN